MDSRRDFLKFVGATGLTLVSSTFFDKLLNQAHAEIPKWDLKIPTVVPTGRDEVVLSRGLNYDIFLKWEDKIPKLFFRGAPSSPHYNTVWSFKMTRK